MTRPVAPVAKPTLPSALLKPNATRSLCSRPFSSRQNRIRSIRVPPLAASAKNDNGFAASATQAISRMGKKTVYLAGVSGPLTTRIAKKLLQNNVQVVTGVPEDDPASEALQFALKYELLKKDEAKRLKIRTVEDFGDPASFGIPSGCIVVVVAGDQQGGLKVDDKVISAVATAAAESRAARLVLVTPLGSSGGGGFFGLFGGGGGSSNGVALKAGTGELKLNRTEQQIVDSELPFTIVRASTDADSDAEGTSGIAATVAGSMGRGAQPLSRGQAASFVSQVVLQGGTDTSFVIEAAAAEEEADTPVALTVAQVLPDAMISNAEEEEEEEEVEEEPQPPPARRQRASRAAPQRAEASQDNEESSPSASSFNLKSLFGGRGAQQAVADVEEEVEEAAEQVAKPARGFLNRRPKVKQQAEEVVEEVAEVAEKAPNPFKSLFGGRPKQAQQEVEEDARELQSSAKSAAASAKRGARRLVPRVAQKVEEVAEAPAEKKSGAFWSMLGADKASAAQEEEEEEAPQPKRFFGLGTQRVKQQADKAQKAAEKAPRAAAKKVKSKASAAAEDAEDAANGKKGGFLQALGIGQKTKYADDE